MHHIFNVFHIFLCIHYFNTFLHLKKWYIVSWNFVVCVIQYLVFFASFSRIFLSVYVVCFKLYLKSEDIHMRRKIQGHKNKRIGKDFTALLFVCTICKFSLFVSVLLY